MKTVGWYISTNAFFVHCNGSSSIPNRMVPLVWVMSLRVPSDAFLFLHAPEWLLKNGAIIGGPTPIVTGEGGAVPGSSPIWLSGPVGEGGR